MLKADEDGRVWLGMHPYLDSTIGIKASVYSLNYIKYLYDFIGQPMGCIVLDVSYDYIRNNISDSGFPDGSAVAFITGDGREICAGEIPVDFKFSDQNYYRNAVTGEAANGSEYVKLDGKRYLFVYLKLEESGSILCCVLPESIIIKKALEVRNITVGTVVSASIIAIVLGLLIAYGFSKTIQNIIRIHSSGRKR